MEPKLKLVRKQKLVEPWFHGMVEQVEPQFFNLLLSNNASESQRQDLGLKRKSIRSRN